MLIDKVSEFSDAQAETTVAAHDSTNQIDCGLANANLGAGTPLWLLAQVNTTCTSGGSATLTVELQDSADNSSYRTLLASRAFDVAELTRGTKLLCVPIPAQHRRYLKVVYTIGTAALTAGKFDAFLCLDPQTK